MYIYLVEMLSPGLNQRLSTWWEGGGGQHRGAQLHAMHLSDWKGWSEDPALPRSHLRVGSGSKGISLETPAYLRSSEGKEILSFIFVPVVFE